MSLYISNFDMKKFVKKVALFLGIILTVNVLYLVLLNQLPAYIGYFKIPEDPDRIETIILADSHGEVLKQDSLPDHIYNFSYGSDSYLDNRMKLSYARTHFKNLKNVIISVDEHEFLSYREKFNNNDKSLWYSDYEGYKEWFPKTNRVNYLMSKFVQQYVPVASKKNSALVWQFLKGSLFERNSENNATKTKPDRWCDIPNDKQLSLEENRVNYQFETMFNKGLGETFIRILEDAKQDGLKTVGVKFPLTGRYKERLKNYDFTEVQKVLSKSGVKVLDFSDSIEDICLFKDQDHLNSVGSMILLGLMEQELATYPCP